MSEINEARDRLKANWSGLCGSWFNAREHWRDVVGDSFERRYWQEWEAELPQLLSSMDDLDEILTQALERTE